VSDIRATLEAVRQRLNESLQAAEPRPEEWVVLSNLVDPEGKGYDGARNRLVMFLANVQKETVVSTSRGMVPAGDSHYSLVAPPLYVNLYVLVFANFYDAGYAEGLRVLSLAISFFQQNPAFTSATLPALPAGVDRLTWEMESLGPTDLSYLVGLAGVKYLPAVVYKVRLLPFQSGAVQAQAPAVQGLQSPGQPGGPAGLPQPAPVPDRGDRE
jgi:Pvc16 N-terminal domain